MTVDRNVEVPERFPELKAATPWLELKADSIARHFDGDETVVSTIRDKVLQCLKDAYSEGYADRMKSEVAELKTDTPKRMTRRRKK